METDDTTESMKTISEKIRAAHLQQPEEISENTKPEDEEPPEVEVPENEAVPEPEKPGELTEQEMNQNPHELLGDPKEQITPMEDKFLTDLEKRTMDLNLKKLAAIEVVRRGRHKGTPWKVIRHTTPLAGEYWYELDVGDGAYQNEAESAATAEAMAKEFIDLHQEDDEFSSGKKKARLADVIDRGYHKGIDWVLYSDGPNSFYIKIKGKEFWVEGAGDAEAEAITRIEKFLQTGRLSKYDSKTDPEGIKEMMAVASKHFKSFVEKQIEKNVRVASLVRRNKK